MDESWFSFLCLSLACIVFQGIFALFEMACVSFNKIRLEYLASIGSRRAIWLNEFIRKPSRLFGTTLIGLTASLQVGSECSRRFYEALGFHPDLAPLSQAVLVILFGELVPMFAARLHPEPLALSLAPIMLVISKVLSPIVWLFDMMAKGTHCLLGKSSEGPLFLSREEVQKAFEEGDETKKDLNAIVANVFQMKNLLAKQSMLPLHSIRLIPSNALVGEIRQQISIRYAPFFAVYARHPQNIVSIVHLRDLLRLDSTKKVVDAARPPWFVTQDASLLQILEQFKNNNQTVAVILDPGGHALGILTLDQIIDALFGPEQYSLAETDKGRIHVDRTISGSLLVEQFNREFHADFHAAPQETVSDLIVRNLGHLPEKGESRLIGAFEFTVLETTLRGAKAVAVKSLD